MDQDLTCDGCRVARGYAALMADAEAAGLARSVPWPEPVTRRVARPPGPRQIRRAPWQERVRVRLLYPTIG
jgi:hypothetical protein